MTDIIIQGIYGRMGRALVEKIGARDDCRVVAGVDRDAGRMRAASRSTPGFAAAALQGRHHRLFLTRRGGGRRAVRCRERPALRHLLHRPVQGG